MVNQDVALDTNIVIALLNGDTLTQQKYANSRALFLPVIVVGELHYGANNSARVAENLRKVHAFIKLYTILEIDERMASAYGRIRFELKNEGKPIPENDIWIAAICISKGLPLATRDGHFQFVQGLEVIHT